MKRWVGVTTSLAVVACIGISALPAANALGDGTQLCTGVDETGVTVDWSGRGIDQLVYGGRVVSVAPGAQWLDLAPDEPMWETLFNFGQWLQPLAEIDAAQAVDIFVDRETAVADPGGGASHDDLLRTGWVEGAVTNRLRVGGCLWQRTNDPRLIAPLEALASAAMDATRYYGPPRFRPHNHGLSSNVVLYLVGGVLARPEWQSFAMERAAADGRRVFDSCGLAFEQSASYQLVNMALWRGANTAMGSQLVSDTAFAHARASVRGLARPDGVVEAIGDGFEYTVARANATDVWCPRSGWAAGTLHGSHFTLRGGPRQWAHGHEDHGSVTWFAHGVPVLSDRGRASKFDEAALAWSRSMKAHSVFEPVGAATSSSTHMHRSGRWRFTLSDSAGGATRERSVHIGRDSLRVIDRGTSLSSDARWIQHWQLAHGWEPDGDSSAVYPDGTRLTIECSSGDVRFARVKSYAASESPSRAWDAQCVVRGSAVSVRTTLTVTAA